MQDKQMGMNVDKIQIVRRLARDGIQGKGPNRKRTHMEKISPIKKKQTQLGISPASGNSPLRKSITPQSPTRIQTPLSGSLVTKKKSLDTNY